MSHVGRPYRPVAAAIALVLALGSAGCRSTRKASEGDPAAAASVAPPVPLVVRDGVEGLTYSFITLDGGFQLARKIAEVPYEARDAVRVWNETSGDGIAGPWIFVADLRNALPDGTYKVEALPRGQFEAMAADRRKAGKNADLARKADPPGSGEPKPAEPAEKKGLPKVIIYGADWCKPCHMAEDYLKRRGIPFEHRDVDDPNVNEEMRDKLAAAGIKGGSIPVLDVAGRILVGFSEGELDRALAAAGG
jgi:glutaredoxin